MQTYLGIDGGGSGSRWARIAADGSLRSHGDDGPAIQVAELGVDVAAGRVAELLDLIAGHAEIADETPVVVGLAGVGSPTVRQDMEERWRTTGRRIRVVEDTVTGAAAALADGPGVAVFAGTGSFAIARDQAGGLHRVGGHGNVASDHGSAYRVVQGAAEAALLAVDGMGSAAGLVAVVREALEVGSADDIGRTLKQRSAWAVARCFPAVVDAAAKDDRDALRVLRDAGSDLARLAAAAAARAGLDAASCTVTLGGGTTRAQLYFRCIGEALDAAGFTGTIRGLPMPAEQGAALLARAWCQEEAPLCRWIDG